MLIRLKDKDGKVAVAADALTWIRHSLDDGRYMQDMLFLEITGATSAVNAIAAHLTSSIFRSDSACDSRVEIKDGRWETVRRGGRYTHFNILTLTPEHLVVCHQGFGHISRQYFLGPAAQPHAAPAPDHFLDAFNRIDIAVLPKWQQQLWQAGIENDMIVHHDTILGDAGAYSLNGTVTSLERWRNYIKTSILNGSLTA